MYLYLHLYNDFTAGFPIDFFADLGSAAEVLERSATLDRSTIQVNCTGSEQSLSLSDCTILDSDNPFSSFVAIKCIGILILLL